MRYVHRFAGFKIWKLYYIFQHVYFWKNIIAHRRTVETRNDTMKKSCNKDRILYTIFLIGSFWTLDRIARSKFTQYIYHRKVFEEVFINIYYIYIYIDRDRKMWSVASGQNRSMKIEQNVKRDSFFEDRPADFVRHEHVPDECKRFFTRKGKGIIFLIKISQRGEKRNETRKRLSDNIYRRIRITTSSSSSSFLNIFLAGRATA